MKRGPVNYRLRSSNRGQRALKYIGIALNVRSCSNQDAEMWAKIAAVEARYAFHYAARWIDDGGRI